MNRGWPSFWDVAYRFGDHRDHWEPPVPPPELVAAWDDGTIVAGATVVDVGCGSGVEAGYLASRGCRVIGVDASVPGLVHARAGGSPSSCCLALCAADVCRLPLGNATVDTVIDRGCLHVIAPRRRAAYASEVARVLRPGGTIVLRGAAHDDEDAGVVAVDPAGVDALFRAPRFRRVAAAPVTLAARAGDLDGWSIVVRG